MTVRRYRVRGELAWGYDFRHDGVRYRARDAGWRKADAEREEHAAKAAALAGTNPAANAPATLADLCRRWIEAVAPERAADHITICRYYLRTLEADAPDIMRRPPMTVSPIHVEALKRAVQKRTNRRGQPISPGTVRHYLTFVQGALSWGRARGWANPRDPFATVALPALPPGRTHYLRPDDAARFLAAIDQPDARRFAALALNTGLRAGELCALTWADIDLEAGVLHVRDSKNRTARAVPLNATARAILEEQREAAGDAKPVFPGPGGRHRAERPRDAIDRAFAAIGQPGMTFHDLRHTFASYAAAAGTDPVTLSALLGHRGLAMVRRYAHLMDDAAAKAVRGVEVGLAGHHMGTLIELRRASNG